MRHSCEVVISVDIEKAINDGIPFFHSKNGVILSPGIGDTGVIPPKYFKEIFLKTVSGMIGVTPKNFKYLLILDFEANCVEEGKLECQEIIEFPVIVVNTETMQIEDDFFHEYIKPKVEIKITEFCTQLTGITQETVDQGIYIEEALAKLDTWINLKGFTIENSIFVTCGAWDLNTCFKNEAKYKKLTFNDLLKRFINIKEVFTQVFMRDKAPGMPGMLAELGLSLDGRHHSGIDDSRNIAKIAIKLAQMGGSFTKFQERVVSSK